MGALRIVMGTGAANARAFLASGKREHKFVPVTVRPIIEGPAGKAWNCDLDAWRKYRFIGKDKDASLDVWIVEAPRFHPVWHSYQISLVHLREMEGVAAPFLAMPDATHEVAVYALDPEVDRNMLIATGRPMGAMLQPVNFAGQMIEATDKRAQDRVMATVQLICEGTLSPDTDHLQTWVALYGNHMIRKEFR